MVSATAADENTLSFLFEAGEIAHHRSGPHRACKEWLTRNRREGYKPTRHQKALTGTLDLERVARRMRSFRRLETAVQEIIAATRAHRHIVSPTP
jgi:hypothetical protein